MTGQYAHQHKTSGNDPAPELAPPNSPRYRQLQLDLIAHVDRQPTLPRLLAAQGYWCHQSGKWWEGSYQRGGFTHGMTRGFPEKGGRHGDDGLAIGREGVAPVLQFIDRAHQAGKPFFVWYAPMLPHTPHNPPERLHQKYAGKDPSEFVTKYYAMCEWFDETCGEILTHLEERKLAENTIVYYVADNGWIQNPTAQGYALKSKQSCNEGGIRQPILIRWPGHIAPGDRKELVTTLDFVPTMLAAAGVNAPPGLAGENLLPFLTAGTPLRDELIYGETFSHDIANLEAPEESLIYRWAIDGRWKLILTYDGADGRRYASSHPRDDVRPQLYDVEADPREEQNLAARHPEIVERLAARIEAWWPAKGRQVVTRWSETR